MLNTLHPRTHHAYQKHITTEDDRLRTKEDILMDSFYSESSVMLSTVIERASIYLP